MCFEISCPWAGPKSSVRRMSMSKVPCSSSMRPFEGQDPVERTRRTDQNGEPSGRDLFIPYVRVPGTAAVHEIRNVEQIRILAEMNMLTVELVKRRSNPYLTQVDTARLVKRLK